jgi:drug/metabolite transporter (DMT)-like permease
VTFSVIAGLIIGITGAIFLITSKENSGTGANIVLGDTLITLNAISYTFYFILVKPLMTRYTPIQVLRWAFTFGTLFILPFGWTEFAEAPWASFSGIELAAIAFVVVGATFVAYLLNIYGLHHLQASATGTYIYLQPIFATGVAVLFLHEKLTAVKIIAAIMIFTGVYLVQRSKLKRTSV